MPFFSNIFKSKDGLSKKSVKNEIVTQAPPQKPRWEDAWMRKDVEPEEVQELLRGCTYEMKARALDMPFLLLPFRPTSDPSAARTFIRNFFNANADRGAPLEGERLSQELRLTEPMVLCSVMKWCWSRLAGGVVTWEAYELFRIGEQDSNNARDAFATFIPISVASDARTKIIFDFFDLMAAIAAHGKTNGMGGRKLSRFGGWWAFEHTDTGNGFDGGYKEWTSAADATSHLFFAYLRSLSPESLQSTNGISALPLSLQTLLQLTEYPPERPALMQSATAKVAMIVDAVSPTPFALLRRAKHFQYRDDDQALQHFSDYDDPVQALTDECRRVLKSISSANDSSISNSKASTGLLDASWSRFEDVGFSGLGDESDHEEVDGSALGKKRPVHQGLRATPFSKTNLGRPTTPSWADFLSSGFVDESGMQGSGGLLLPPDKVLPPINTRGKSSQSHRRPHVDDSELEPGELASITSLDLDDAFWWVWITSLAGEEPIERKAVFGRCALIETNIKGGRWLVMEEMVKGAAPEPEAGAYIAEKKSRFGFSTRSRLKRSKSSGRKPPAPSKVELYQRSTQHSPMSKTSIAPDQHARIQAAAAALQQKNQLQDAEPASPRRGRQGDTVSNKTSSVFTLQPVIMSEAASAMKWANSYDKSAIRAAYLGNNFAGRGSVTDLLGTNGSTTPMAQKSDLLRNQSYGFPKQEPEVPKSNTGIERGQERSLPALPREDSLTPAPDSVIADERMTSNSPAPLPVNPATDMQVANHNAAEAAQIPLPSVTPNEYPRAMERKPLPAIQPQRVQTPVQEPETVASGAEHSDQAIQYQNGYSTAGSSPESKRSEPRKLKKKGTAGGFKGLFGKKKPQVSSSPSSTPSPSNTTAVAAARAALQGSQKPEPTQPRFDASQQTKINRRFSSIVRKKSPNITPIPVQKPDDSLSSHDISEEPPISPVEPTPIPSLNYPRQDDYTYSQASISRIDTNEQRKAEHEFRTFDQGPLEDQPAFVPEDSPSRVSSEFDEAVENEEVHEAEESGHAHDVSENPELIRQISPVQDRWAQIRKNAAERAARQSEEQSRQTDKTDDGETSGEETIESRVARIKARVAELTGNMDSPNYNRR